VSTIVGFEYGPTLSYGDMVTAAQSPLTGMFTLIVRVDITALLPGTTYHFRVKAENELGISWGDDMTFKTIANAIDYDGYVYKTVKIGTQVWIAENLKTIKFNDGTDIPFAKESSEWPTSSTPTYCWYNNDEIKYKTSYGALYNWYAVSSGKLCPTGWHVPSDTDWSVLTNYLGEDEVGAKLREVGTAHWFDNSNSTNETGFTALPGGYCNYSGGFSNIENIGMWWSSTEQSANSAWYRSLMSYYYSMGRNSNNKVYGFSVRCLQD
jgi:uncharacterized protein (TIGR02145 family)